MRLTGLFTSVGSWLRRYVHKIANKPQTFFLIVASIFGFLLVFIIPPFQNIDEPSHFYRSYHLAQGNLNGLKVNDKTGDYLPASLEQTFAKYGYLIFHYGEKASPKGIYKDALSEPSSSTKQFVAFNNTVVYPPFTYAPQAIGIKLMSLFTSSPLLLLYAARIVSLVCWLAATYWIIRLLPIGKWALVVISFFPMVIVQAASSSSDATIFTAALITIGLITRLILQTTSSNRKLLTLLYLVGICLSLIKLPILAILLLTTAIPLDRFGSAWRKAIYISSLAAITLFIAAIWNYGASQLRVELRPEVSLTQQVEHIRQQPVSFGKLFVYYPFQERSDQTLQQVYGWLGWNEVKLPTWMMLYGFTAFLAALSSPSFKQVRITRVTRLIALLTFCIFTIVTITMLYLTWMPVGHPQLYDVWGRYFLAVLPLFILIVGGMISVDKPSWDKVRAYIIISTPIILLLVTMLILNRYYGNLPFGEFRVLRTSVW